MSEKGAVFCFEGMNSRIRNLIDRFDETQFDKLKELCKEAEELTGAELLYYLDSDINDDTIETVFADLVITYICDYIIFETYLSKGVKPEVLIGYSLGLNTALVCAGYLSFSGGIEILKSIKKCLEYSHRELNQDMALIVGLPIDFVREITKKNGWDNYISIASKNSENSLLLTGEKTYIERTIEVATNEGALKAVKLNTLIAFHHGKKEDWIEDCIKGMDNLVIYKGKRNVMSVYSLDFVKDQDILVIEELKKNVYTPMMWGEAIRELENRGYSQFWDVSLDGNVKKISSLDNQESVFYTYKSLKSL